MRILFFLLFVNVAFAQDLPCATLLEALPNTRFNELTSFEANFSFNENAEPFNARLVRDVTGQRSYYEMKDMSGEVSVARYEGDTGTLERNGQLEVAPPEAEAEVISFFDIFLSQKLFREAELVGCDGPQTLQTPEGTVKGEAISLVIMDDPAQLFFDEDGRVVAFSSSNDVGLFDSQYEDDLLVKSDFRIYSVDTQNLVRTMTFELVNYNLPIDETLFAEDLECASLLETFKNEPEFTSLETSTTYMQDPSQPSDYKVIDFVNERVYWEITLDAITYVYRYLDGNVTGATKTNGKETAADVPEYIRLPLETTFTNSNAFRDLADKAVVLSCDGEQSYRDENGEIVRGQQLTVADKTNSESDSTKLLFDDEGNFIANYVDRPDDGQDFLVVSLDRKKDEAGVTVNITNATYRQNGDSFELISKTTTQTLSYNQSVDETLFTE